MPQEIRGRQIRGDTVKGSDLYDGIGIYDETDNYIIGDIVLWEASRFRATANVTGTTEGSFAQSPEISGDWAELGFYPAPIIIGTPPITKYNHSTTGDFTITGDFFTPSTTVTIVSQTVNTVTFVDSHTLIVNVTSNNVDGLYSITVTTDEGGSSVFVNYFEVELSTWLDLRLGGDTFTDGNGAGNDIRYRTGMSLTRDANGMFFSGLNPWSSWVKFESEGWTRGTNQTVKWVFTGPTANMMIGIFSDATNEGSGAQYAQAEVEAYFNTGTNFWGLYGNSGTPGAAGSQSSSQPIVASAPFRAEFTQDGGLGGTFNLYQLPTANPADWDDTSNLVKTMAIGGTVNPDEANIMPGIIPRSGTAQRFIALRVGV